MLLSNIKKNFGQVEVLKGVDLSIRRGEFITLLGASGCGKTTILRIIAGLETADSGILSMDGVDIGGFDPDKRGVNMVFQSYALFPHMNVEQNTGYSLKFKRMQKAEIHRAVAEALELVQLSGYERRKPDELSGGQRQRVALARALINRPKVLLLDEPLGALDLQLRRQMQTELKSLQKQTGITFIYITHDQEEALAMSDRVAVIRNGVVEQIGSAAEVYKNPRTAFVAKFVGNANLIYRNDECLAVREENIILTAPASTNMTPDGGGGGQPSLQTDPSNTMAGEVTGKIFACGLLRIFVKLKAGGAEVSASMQGFDTPFKEGDDVLVSWRPENAVKVTAE